MQEVTWRSVSRICPFLKSLVAFQMESHVVKVLGQCSLKGARPVKGALENQLSPVNLQVELLQGLSKGEEATSGFTSSKRTRRQTDMESKRRPFQEDSKLGRTPS